MVIENIDISAIKRLSPENLSIIQSLIRQMTNGVDPEIGRRLKKPVDGVLHWQAKLRQERYVTTTIRMYTYYAAAFLRDQPTSTNQDIQLYLAHRMESGTSPAAVENIRKSLHSLFSYLYEEGLWHEGLTRGIRKVKVRKFSGRL